MAKAKALTGLDPHAPTEQNARRIARTRLDEMNSWAANVDNPYEVQGLHNLRIAAKRLRYTLEIFEDSCYYTRLSWPVCLIRMVHPLLSSVLDLSNCC